MNAMFIRTGKRICSSVSNNNNSRLLLKITSQPRNFSTLGNSNIQRVTTLRSNYAVPIINNVIDAEYQYLKTVNRRSLSDKSDESKTEPSEEASQSPPETDENNTEEVAGDEEGGKKDEEKELSREEKLENEIQDLKNNLLRSLAEQENTRMIAKKDVESARNFAIKSFAKGLLDVSDNLSRAMDAVPEELRTTKEDGENSEVNNVLATLYEGIQMTEAGLTKAFQSNGLVKYGKDGDVFDPNVHNALFEFPDEKKQAGTVGQVIKDGFMLNSRVLRPAEVGVVKKP